MFSYFLLKMADTVALELNVDLYEPRHFCHRGPAGCNHCGGIVSESLVQRLATEGIALPDDVVQRGIESYTLHMDVGDVEFATPLHERRIAAIYRGNGPRNSEPLDTHSFDGYLQQLAYDVEKVVRQVPGALGVAPSRVQGKPYVEIEPDTYQFIFLNPNDANYSPPAGT